MTKENIIKEIIDWLKYLAIAIVLALLINNFVIINAEVPTGSMENTIKIQDRLFAFRLAYMFSEPKRGDIVVFKYPDDESVPYVKRIVGLPGETVEIKDSKVYIDDKILKEPYLDVTTKGTFGPYEVPEESYFMLGDNRNYSKDSRFWNNNYVHEDKILGKIVFRYWPNPTIMTDK